MTDPNVVKAVYATVVMLAAGEIPPLHIMCHEQDWATCSKYMVANDDAEIRGGKFHER